MPEKNTKNEFIEKSITKHGDKYDYSKVDVSGQKVIIICKIHGEFEQLKNNHIRGMGCRKCGKIQMGNNNTKTTEQFISEAQKVHGNKYDYSKSIYVNGNKKIIIICLLHNEFLMAPKSHILKKIGCTKCKVKISYINMNKQDFIEKANKIHNNKYDYSKINIINAKTKTIFLCRYHGDFEQTPYQHLNGQGCPKCGILKFAKTKTKSVQDYINECKLIHGDEYDYSKTVYNRYDEKVEIICKIHGSFFQDPCVHNNGYGCPKCSGCKTDREEFIEKAKKIHGENYNYDKVEYINRRGNIIITCKKHGDFLQSADTHLNGSGCSKCNSKRYSKISLQWLNYIALDRDIQTAQSLNGEYQIPDTPYTADGYCKDTNTIYEFHGILWHGSPDIYDQNKKHPIKNVTFGELYKRTLKKKEIIENLGYNYVEMWEHKWCKAIRTLKKIQKMWCKKKN